MSEGAQARDLHPRPKCDHICLKDEGHVHRGEHHFYGYELPSPRRTEAQRDRAIEALNTIQWLCNGSDEDDPHAIVPEVYRLAAETLKDLVGPISLNRGKADSDG